MSIAIFGAGAVGSVLGGFLAEAGEDVVLIGRKPHVDVIIKEGLTIEGVRGTHHVRIDATTDPKKIRGRDYILVCVKAQDTGKVSSALSKYATGIIVSVQNGVRNHQTIEKITGKKCLSAITDFNAVFFTPGKVILQSDGEIILGDPFGFRKEKLNAMQQTLSKAFRTRITNDIHQLLWGKVVLNLLNPLPAISSKGFIESMRDPDFIYCAQMVLKESTKVLRVAGIQWRIPTWGLWLFSKIIFFPPPVAYLISNFSKRELIPSTSQDLQKRKKPKELKFINGEIIELGRRYGLPTPTNNRLLKLCISGKTRSYQDIRKELTKP